MLCWAVKLFLLVYKFFEFAGERIPATRNKAEIIFSLKNQLQHWNCR